MRVWYIVCVWCVVCVLTCVCDFVYLHYVYMCVCSCASSVQACVTMHVDKWRSAYTTMHVLVCAGVNFICITVYIYRMGVVK